MNRLYLVLFLLPAVLVASATAAPAPHRETTEQLYMNFKELDRIYKDLHKHAQIAAGESDKQLDYIQKIYLFVGDAKQSNYYLWRILSVDDYIRSGYKKDYYTLTIRDLKQAVSDGRLTSTLLQLYSVYVEGEEVKKTTVEAIGLIEANIYLYERLQRLLGPLANPPRFELKLPNPGDS